MTTLPHPTSSVSIPATIKLMCINLHSDNHQPLSIAATAPYRPERQMILSGQTSRYYRRPTKLCRVAATATAASLKTTAGPAWLSFAPVTSADVGNAVCVCVRSIRATCPVVSIGLPVSLAVDQKRSKDDRNKKMNTLFTNRKSESNLKTWNLSAKNAAV